MKEVLDRSLVMEQIAEALRLSQNLKIGDGKQEVVASAVEEFSKFLENTNLNFEFVSNVPEGAELVEGFTNVESSKLSSKTTLLEGLKGEIVFKVGIKNPFPHMEQYNDLTLSAYIKPGKGPLNKLSVPVMVDGLKKGSSVLAKGAKTATKVLAVLGGLGTVGYGLYKGIPAWYKYSGCYVQGPDEKGRYDPIECRGGVNELHPFIWNQLPAQREIASLNERKLQPWHPLYQYKIDTDGAPVPVKDAEGNILPYEYEHSYGYPPMEGSENIVPMVFPNSFIKENPTDTISILDLPQIKPQPVPGKYSNRFEVNTSGVLTAGVYFETNISTLTEADITDIKNLIGVLQERKINSITLYGQTDLVGTKEHNEQLAAARIASVKALFDEAKIVVQAINRGEQGDFEYGEGQERRVEIVAQRALDLVLEATKPQIVLFDNSVRVMSSQDKEALMTHLARVPQVFETNTLPSLVEEDLKTWSQRNLDHPFLGYRDGLEGEITDLLSYVENNLLVYLGHNEIDRTYPKGEDGLMQWDAEGALVFEETVIPRDLVITILGNTKNMGELNTDRLLERLRYLKEGGLTVVINYYVDEALSEKDQGFTQQIRGFVEGTGGQFFETR